MLNRSVSPRQWFAFTFLAVLAWAAVWSPAQGQTATVAARMQSAIDRGEFPSWWTPKLPTEVERDVISKGNRLASQLELGSDSKTQKVSALITEHFGRVWAWHQQVDAQLDAGWKAWDAARDNSNGKNKDELGALVVWTEQLEPIYAEFTPQVSSLLRALEHEIGEEKTTQLQDLITRSPGAKRTYDAYLAMIPELKEGEKAILWNRMVRARDDSMAAWSDKQIVKLFKMYKVRNELSIDQFGYNYRQRYEQWSKAK